MNRMHRPVLSLLIALALMTPAMSGAGANRSSGSPPIITALVEPPDGAMVVASSRPTFAFEATPGGRFRVEFSSGKTPFIPMLSSGRRTTPGDQFKPSEKQWRTILDLAAVTNTVYWRVLALGMSEEQIAAAPISSFIVTQ